MAQNNLPFRPLDNSSSTRLSYTLEAQHWLRALNSSQASVTSALSVLGIIGAMISIVVCLVIIILTLVVKLLIFIIGLFEKPTTNTTTRKYIPQKPSHPDDEYFNKW